MNYLEEANRSPESADSFVGSLDEETEEIKQIEKQKSDGEPYARMFDEEYSKMTKEEKEQTDKFMKELDEIIGFDNEFEKGKRDNL